MASRRRLFSGLKKTRAISREVGNVAPGQIPCPLLKSVLAIELLAHGSFFIKVMNDPIELGKGDFV